MPAPPSYAKLEIERRWLVPAEPEVGGVATRERIIEDRYVKGTRLRLRKVTETGNATIYKLGKKYESDCPGTHHVVSIYLSEAEYNVLACLPAHTATKIRLTISGGALDVYEEPNAGLRVFEVEFLSAKEAVAYVPPSGVGREVTNEPAFTGHALASAAYPSRKLTC
jgi:CYTH domain-containing protein